MNQSNKQQVNKNQKNQESELKKQIEKKGLLNIQEQILYHTVFMKLFKISGNLFSKIQTDPDIKVKTNLGSDLYSKTVRSLQFNKNNVIINMKKYKSKLRPIQEYVQDLKSLNDQYFYDMAVFIQCLHIHGQTNQMSTFRKKNLEDSSHHEILPQLLTKKQGKNFFLMFLQKSKNELALDKLIISRSLLKILGYTDEQLKLQFLKYGCVFFQLFDKDFYSKFCQELGKSIKKFVDKQQVQVSNQDQNKKFFLDFDDFLFKKTNKENQSELQKKIPARIQYYKPHHKISVFQFRVQENAPFQDILIKQCQQKRKIQKQNLVNQKKSLQYVIQQISEVDQKQILNDEKGKQGL